MVRLRVKEHRTQLIENAVQSLYPPLANYSLTPVDGPFYSVHILDCPLTALATDPLNSQSIATELSAKIQFPVHIAPFQPLNDTLKSRPNRLEDTLAADPEYIRFLNFIKENPTQIHSYELPVIHDIKISDVTVVRKEKSDKKDDKKKSEKGRFDQKPDRKSERNKSSEKKADSLVKIKDDNKKGTSKRILSKKMSNSESLNSATQGTSLERSLISISNSLSSIASKDKKNDKKPSEKDQKAIGNSTPSTSGSPNVVVVMKRNNTNSSEIPVEKSTTNPKEKNNNEKSNLKSNRSEQKKKSDKNMKLTIDGDPLKSNSSISIAIEKKKKATTLMNQGVDS